jgi:uncharacterized membrane protein (UPF0127 family)
MVQGEWVIRNVTRDKVLADKAAEARAFGSRFMGLMGQTDLPIGHGLHIVPCNSIHTFFMRIPIDALFLSAQGTVVKVMGALPPWRMTSVYFSAHSVLELPAGVAAASGTVEGDQLEFTRGKIPSP